ncbi:formimidoylglutamase [Peribacillus deserti]|uniref:Formimidoylglutamase n=1 Tax=Peribacillus deserti TaxID=673318 RepID=A0A2N5M8P1_9BACI|nr:formimidoylglutamase [Peribacillus deserti]PLT30716.1 formimidoylglutamase [Peribacillus deserti]
MYELTKPHIWSGRIDSTERPEMFRLHQSVECKSVYEYVQVLGKNSMGIIGFKCDEGVRRNQGRTGSFEAPDALRKNLASLPMPPGASIYDFGNIICEDGRLEAAQKELGEAVSRLLQQNIFPIILGGGHEVAYGHYLGYKQWELSNLKMGIVNIDAHFDMRPYTDQTSSGTMFRQILDENPNASYFCAGIQKNGNTSYLFNTAAEYGCEYILEDEIHQESIQDCLQKADEFVKKSDFSMLTLCSDVLEASSAPGVSAPSPFGLHPKLVRTLLGRLAANPKIKSFDIAEVNPKLDIGDRTVKLGAQLVFEVICARNNL